MNSYYSAMSDVDRYSYAQPNIHHSKKLKKRKKTKNKHFNQENSI